MAGFGLRLAGATLLVACFASCILLTDAATRLAYDIEREAGRLRTSGEASRTFDHRPRSSPAGCSGGSTVTLSSGGLGVYCADGRPVPPAARGHVFSYTTTYHRRFVEVPQALTVDVGRNATVRITLRKQGRRIIVAALEAVP